MAQIKINPERVIEACEKVLKYMAIPQTSYRLIEKDEIEEGNYFTDDQIIAIKELAEYSVNNPPNRWISRNVAAVGESEIFLNHEEFQLLKEHL